MKFCTPILLAPLLGLCMASAMAAPAADLQVAGKVLASACTLDAGSSADFELDFDFDPALPDREFVLSKASKQIAVTVVCGGDTAVALKVRDNGGSKLGIPMDFRYGSAPTIISVLPDNYQSLQNADNGKLIGAMLVGYRFIRVDDKINNIYINSGDGETWNFASEIASFALSSSSAPYVTASSSITFPTPASGRKFEFPVHVAATVLTSEAPATASFSVGGSITMELITL